MTLLNGDAYKLIKDMPDNSVDLIVTDPPYLYNISQTQDKDCRYANDANALRADLAKLSDGYDMSILDEFVRVMKKINIYIWCSNKQLAELIKGKGYAYTGRILPTGAFSGYVPEREEQTIYCDSAEPKSIADLQENGLNARPCHKYQGSVLYGIRWLQHRTIVIDPARTPHAHKEFSTYEYKTTRDGEFLADVKDENNHTIDACRYALDELISYRGVSA